MRMPLYAWSAYVHRAVLIQNADTMRMAVASSIPHMERGDRDRVLADLQAPVIEAEAEVMTKEEFIARLEIIGIGAELN